MPRLVRDLARGMIDVMMIPFNIFAMGGQLLLGRLGNAAAGAGAGAQYKKEKERQTKYCQAVELTAQPGRAKEIVNAFRNQVKPKLVSPSEGFVNGIHLLSEAETNN